MIPDQKSNRIFNIKINMSELLTPPSEARRGYTKSLLVLDVHFRLVMIRKNQFMIEGNHKIQTLSRSPRQKVRGAK